ncbi:MAG: hypothetical protein KKE02_01470 [Alphaproteobacteria bacterium]|nr:hypothetical protein [Alphaproteobacteria bacterium]MBU1513773.1 hypothetical protein [Alphaproteobacteria bacterium]MBU2094582.1 hypothetical protein [Alphaproteobacteria bacterium]MBU2149659.1 hypothetical protein [Alphaproteobacteria bacterium]MBU2309122.1 hypothetical protein [Alphaproteobacteria bacterium]
MQEDANGELSLGRSEFQLPSAWSKATESVSSHHEGKTFTGRVLLDGSSFERCRFQRAVLIYAGGAPPRLSDCVFTDATFEFQGAAARTLTFLQAMSAPSSGLAAVFKASFNRLFGH